MKLLPNIEKPNLVDYIISTFRYKSGEIFRNTVNDRLQEFITKSVEPPKNHKEFDLILAESGLPI